MFALKSDLVKILTPGGTLWYRQRSRDILEFTRDTMEFTGKVASKVPNQEILRAMCPARWCRFKQLWWYHGVLLGKGLQVVLFSLLVVSCIENGMGSSHLSGS